VNSAFIRVTALALGTLFLIGAAVAAVKLWRDGDWFGSPNLKIAAAWFTTGAIFLAFGFRGRRR